MISSPIETSMMFVIIFFCRFGDLNESVYSN